MGNDFDYVFYLDYLGKTFVGADGSAADGIGMTLGDQYQCGLKTLLRDTNGVSEVQKKVKSLKASIGLQMAPPAAGNFTLKFTNGAGQGTTAAIAFDGDAAAFTTACATALDSGHANLTLGNLRLAAPSCWVFSLGNADTEPVTIERISNTLDPASFVRIRPYQNDGAWLYEVRLIQSALVFTGASERVLPTGPSIQRIKPGSARIPGSANNTNEVQSLVLPKEFQGTYQLTWDYRTTRVLGIDAGIDEIATALNALYDDGLTRFLVTNPIDGEAYIEFTGPLAEAPQQPDIAVSVPADSVPPGTLRFTLNCDTEELAAALRVAPVLTEIPFELELRVVDDDQDPTDPDIAGRKITFQTTVSLRADTIFDELASRNPVDWLRPPQPTNYNPVSPNQIIVGQQNFEMAFGDPDALQYVFEHDLHTAAGWVAIRTNDDTGRVLGQATEYSLEQAADVITVNLLSAPTENGLVLTFLAAGPKSAFLAHTHAISDIIGLEARLVALESSVATITDRLPFTTPAIITAASADYTFPIRAKFGASPGRFSGPQTGPDPILPIRTGALPPALHDASVTATDLSASVPDLTTAKGNVYQHTGTPDVTLPGLRGHKSPVVKTNDYVGCDGRGWYFVTREGTSNSWYATDMEETLFILPVNAKMLRAGQALSLGFHLAGQMLATSAGSAAAEVAMQQLLVLDTGISRAVTSPSPVGTNLKDILWNTTPIVRQQLILSSLLVEEDFGLEILRAPDGTFSANGIYYGAAEAANDGIPAAPNFVLRGRLVEADPVDDVVDPRGSRYWAFTQGTVTIR